MKKALSIFLCFITIITTLCGFGTISAQAVTVPKVVVNSCSGANKKSGSTYTLKWKACIGADGYQIQVKGYHKDKSKKKSGYYWKLTTNVANTAIQKTLKNNGYFTYDSKISMRIRAYKISNKKKVYGSWTTVNKGYKRKIAIAPPKVFNLYPQANQKVKLTWTKVSKAKNYRIYQSSKPLTGYKKIKTTTSTQAIISGIDSSKKYYFVVRAFDGKKESECSYIVSTWGRITNMTNEYYDISDALNLPDGTENVTAAIITFDKISDVQSYQIFWDVLNIYTSKKTSSNKLYAECGNLMIEKIRANKNVNGMQVYGPWRFLDNCDFENIYSPTIAEWNNLKKGYTHL